MNSTKSDQQLDLTYTYLSQLFVKQDRVIAIDFFLRHRQRGYSLDDLQKELYLNLPNSISIYFIKEVVDELMVLKIIYVKSDQYFLNTNAKIVGILKHFEHELNNYFQTLGGSIKLRGIIKDK